MIQLFAPHPDAKQLMYLPNPEWGDVERLESTMQLHRSMNGAVVVTHIRKQVASRSYELDLQLTRMKSLEYLEFLAIWSGVKMKLVDHHAIERIGYVKVNPVELEKIRRSLVSDSTEAVSTRMEFETVQ